MYRSRLGSSILVRLGTLILWVSMAPSTGFGGEVPGTRILLSQVNILVDENEPSFVQYGANDLSAYLSEISGVPVAVENSRSRGRDSKTTLVIGRKMAAALGLNLDFADLGEEGALIRSLSISNAPVVVVAGASPHGTNWGIASLLKLIHLETGEPYPQGPLDLHSEPRMAIRGLHLNGGLLNYPYGFRNWKEQDWKRFIDISWAHRANLILLWPFMEIMPVPLSSEDAAYLEEVRRIVDYAQRQRGIKIWIMHWQTASYFGLRQPRSSGTHVLGPVLSERPQSRRFTTIRADC